ncbi:E3 UBIQUITIN-PROTEIN LIGASE PRAJA [Salix koriyanagi]|uniref:RING-type E3 ubiquitin transferase n=1 Tax=Salix koriyanagi TaxID=2511006 RepID=A0A9Q0X2G2_9ROSI|nr:E3 UBIQUITIN-PROTEIN LIGASE PRAJA [Salix koriyanagi]
MASTTSASYWCYRCARFVTVSPLNDDEEQNHINNITCPHCDGGFVEEIQSNRDSRQNRNRVSNFIRNRRNAGVRSPYNPVIVLRGTGPAAAAEENDERGAYEFYYDDGTGSGLRPVPETMSEFLMVSGFDRLLDQLSQIEINSLGRHELPVDNSEEEESEEEIVGLTIWRLPGGGFAVGRFSGGRIGGEREFPGVFTEMDGGGNSGLSGNRRPRNWDSWVARSRGREGSGGSGGFRRVFRGVASFLRRIRPNSSSRMHDGLIGGDIIWGYREMGLGLRMKQRMAEFSSSVISILLPVAQKHQVAPQLKSSMGSDHSYFLDCEWWSICGALSNDNGS